MLRFQGRLRFFGSDEIVEFAAGNAALAAWERYAIRNKMPMGKESPPLLSSLVVAHHALGIEQGFDAWAETVESIELDATDLDGDGKPIDVPPTHAAASTE